MNLKKTKPNHLVLAALSLIGAPLLFAASQSGKRATPAPAPLAPASKVPVTLANSTSTIASPATAGAHFSQMAARKDTKPNVARLERLARQRYLAQNPSKGQQPIKLGSYEEVAHLVPRSNWEALSTTQRQLAVSLVRDAHKGVIGVMPCFAPGTDLSVVQAFEGISNGLQFYRTNQYWTNTASGPHATGEPITLTWSIVPDGTPIFGAGGEATAPSDLVAKLNGIYGSKEKWLPYFRRTFARYTELTGIRYIEETNDDGVEINQNSTSPGVLGVRGDVRIGAHVIDGASGILAYNYFPNVSDMVIDSADLVTDDPRFPGFFTDTSQDSLGLRNVIAHEHGHGLGFNHVCPITETKLMEPFVSYEFDGPQLDDIQNAQRGYGDTFEENDIQAGGTPLGTLSAGTVSKTILSIDSKTDVDFFRFSTSGGKSVSVTVSPIGGTYLEGPQNNNGSCSAGTTFNATAQRNLKVSVLNNAGEVIATADKTAAGGVETLDPTILPRNTGPFSVKVEGDDKDVLQLYNLDITLADVNEGPGLSLSDPRALEGNSGTANNLEFNVTLSTTSKSDITVKYATSDGTAKAGTDYQATTGTLTIPAGQLSGIVKVPIIGDTLDESDETVNLTLSEPSNAFILDGGGIGTIRDDDAGPALSISNSSVTEGDSGSVFSIFTVTLATTSTKTVTVKYATSDNTATAGADYSSTSGLLTFEPGERTKVFAVTVLGDTNSETNETYFVNLSEATNAFIEKPQGIGTIRDDDESQVSINDVTVTEGDLGAANARAIFIISLKAPSSAQIKVNYGTRGGTAQADVDYQTKVGTLVFAPGEVTKELLVPVKGDALYEGTERFTVKLSSPVNVRIADAEGVGTIIDNDKQPTVSINDVTLVEGNSSTAKMNFTVSLSKAVVLASQTVKVNYATVNGTAKSDSDYTTVKGTLVFEPGVRTKTIAVPVRGDVLNEANETFTIKLSSLQGGTFGDTEAVGTIRNDDALPALSISNVSIAEGNSGTNNAIFELKLSAASGQEVRMNYLTRPGTATEGVDYVPTTGTLTWAPGERLKTVTVPVKGDEIHELAESFTLGFSTLTNANAVGDAAKGTATILDNDAEPSISVDDVSVTEGNSGTTELFFTVKLSEFSGLPVKVNYATRGGSATAGTDFESTSGTLVFEPGEIVKIVKVLVKTDKVVESNEEFTLRLSSNTGGSLENSFGVGTIVNDDSSTGAVAAPSAGNS